IARPVLGRVDDDALWIVEGEIKADLSAERLRAVVVSIPGVSLWARALQDLAILSPRGRRIVVAMDADWQRNPQVHQAIWCLARCGESLGYRVEIALWNLTHKGLDDLLTAGLRPERKPPTAILAPTWTPRVSSRILADTPTMVGTE